MSDIIILPSSPIYAHLKNAFSMTGPLKKLPGGEGRTYRAGEVVYRKESDYPLAAYIAEVYSKLSGEYFRTPRPIRANDDTWVSSDGWTAWTFVSGEAARKEQVNEIIPAIHNYHRELANFPRQSYDAIARYDTPYSRADEAIWGQLPEDIHPRLRPFVTALLQVHQPIEPFQEQLIHGDLNEENILISPALPPAIIDFTPYWRPPEFAFAIVAYWLGACTGDINVLNAFTSIPSIEQMLIRAALRMILIGHELNKLDSSTEINEEEFQTPVSTIIQWVQQKPHK